MRSRARRRRCRFECVARAAEAHDCAAQRARERPVSPPPPPFPAHRRAHLQRDLGQLYDDAMRLATDAPHHAGYRGGGEAVPADVLNRAHRLLLSTGGYDVEAAARDAHQLQVKVGGRGRPRGFPGACGAPDDYARPTHTRARRPAPPRSPALPAPRS